MPSFAKAKHLNLTESQKNTFKWFKSVTSVINTNKTCRKYN